MNELKPEDVMKALECHSLEDISTCDDCPYCDISEQGNCGCDMARDALALLREKDAHIKVLDEDRLGWADEAVKAQMQVNEKDAEIERLTKERDEARTDCAIAEQLHYECKKELEEMSDDIFDSVRAERDRYKAESERYQSAFLKAQMDAEQERFQCKNICEPTYKNLLETARADAITEFAERVKTFYRNLKGKTIGGSVEYHIEQIANELRGKRR